MEQKKTDSKHLRKSRLYRPKPTASNRPMKATWHTDGSQSDGTAPKERIAFRYGNYDKIPNGSAALIAGDIEVTATGALMEQESKRRLPAELRRLASRGSCKSCATPLRGPCHLTGDARRSNPEAHAPKRRLIIPNFIPSKLSNKARQATSSPRD
jgi:hypothetical protein